MENPNPKVSVIVPVYNVEHYLAKCLDSLVNQSLQNIEIIVVNDGSKDDSGNIIQQYSEKYSDKIKAFTKENGGLSDARNFGIDQATGDYLGFVDSDDYVSGTMFEEMLSLAEKKRCRNGDLQYSESRRGWKCNAKIAPDSEYA